jgi:energy-coupling factor transporter ATP-binding protein EcfA2
MQITLTMPIRRTPRVLQVEGLFDLPPTEQATLSWDVTLPLEERPWNIGLIVGPSGSGKSTVVRHLFAEPLRAIELLPPWPEDQSVLDAFPAEMPVKEVVGLLSSVGFSSPPAWLRPFRLLSTGEQFRAGLARLLALAPAIAVVDEYTSVVDRTVAQVGSAALAKTVRRRNQKFVAVTCHEDVEGWLQPDWVYRPADNSFAWRCLQRRPPISLVVRRVPQAAWRLFRHHHYLSGQLARSSVCFVAFWQGRPTAFSAWMPLMGRRRTRREHRTVSLPDYQGVGIGHALSGFCASLWKGLGYRVTSTTTHPAFLAARQRSPDWRLVRRPSLGSRPSLRCAFLKHATTRLTATFEYIGPALDRREAWALLARDFSCPVHRG